MRNGYNKDFLDGFTIALPEPSLPLEVDVLQPPKLPDGQVVVDYINYSLLMSKSTKQALYSAANVDTEQIKTVKGRKWFYDYRIGRKNQTQNYAYEHTQWDRGHLTRRTAVTWGENKTIATKAKSCLINS